jgi:Tol biopolymer transport system component
VKVLHAGIVVLVLAVVLCGGIVYSLANRPPPFPNPVANITVSLPQGVTYRQLTVGTWNDRYPAWGPNGKSIAYISDRGALQSLWLMDASGLHQKQLSDGSELAAYPSWSPDASKIAFWALSSQSSQFKVLRLSDNSTLSVPGSGPGAIQGAAAWSPDSSRLAFFTNQGTTQLLVYDFKVGSSVAAASANGSMLAVSWASNDRLVYSSTVGGYNEMMWVSLSTNQSGVLLSGQANFVAPSVGPNGSLSYYSDLAPKSDAQFLYGYGAYNIWTSTANGTNAKFQFNTVLFSEATPGFTDVPYVPGAMILASPPVWNPSGNKLAYSATGSIFTALFIWDVGNWTTSSIGPVQAGVNVFQPTWSADGSNIAFSCNLSGTYHIWVMPSAGGAVPSIFTGY